MLFLLAPMTVFAANKVEVIPLFGDCPASVCNPLKNIVTVGKSNGMFTDPVAAMNSITDASETNPYLVVIGPGDYTITSTLVMKRFVHIAGSGENVTKIKGAISGATPAGSAIISGASYATLSSLDVINIGGGTYSIALYNNAIGYLTVSNVVAVASNGVRSSAIFNEDLTTTLTMTNVTAQASNGTTNVGVYNNSAYPTMTNVIARSFGGTINYGFYNISSSPAVMTNVTAQASYGMHNYGVYNISSNAVMDNVTAKAYLGSGNDYGVYNHNSSPKIRRSTMSCDTNSLYSHDGTTTVSQSTIINGVSGPGTKTCVACDNGEGLPLDTDCIPIP